MGRDQQQVVIGGTQHRADQFVVLAQVDADQPTGAVGVEVGQLTLLDQTIAGGKYQIRRGGVVLDLHDLGDLLVGLEGEQVRHMLAAGIAVGLG